MKHCLNILAAAVLTAAFFVPGSGLLAKSDSDARPNVVIVITDDQGYGDISFHGNPVLKTPALDAFAQKSIRLTKLS